MPVQNYLFPDLAAAEAAANELYQQFLTWKRQTDPDAVTPEGEVIWRDPRTGELDPTAPRVKGWCEPVLTVQGYALNAPQHEAYRDPEGVSPVGEVNPWPSRAGDPPELPEWVQPTGAHDAYPEGFWVTRGGFNYISTIPANVWEPTPESNYWRITPDPGPLPWKQPSGAMDAYAKGDRVTHTYPGRDETLWESNIPANTYEPGGDGRFDRWWKPITEAGTGPQPWVQPVPGAIPPYEVDARVIEADGTVLRNTVPMNVWPPTGPGAYGWVVEGAPVRARDDLGRFVGDDPATPEVNEAWTQHVPKKKRKR